MFIFIILHINFICYFVQLQRLIFHRLWDVRCAAAEAIGLLSSLSFSYTELATQSDSIPSEFVSPDSDQSTFNTNQQATCSNKNTFIYFSRRHLRLSALSDNIEAILNFRLGLFAAPDSIFSAGSFRLSI